MPQINLLSPHVADLIAAGEVVERPASVIKELVENAFDAGAKHVTVEIRDGGATMIRVTDDGCGMAPEDAGIAFLRHATSKLHDEHGLEAIQTMGFRGEALAAISAVSHIELTTRRPEDLEGTRMTLTAGDIDEMEVTGCPAGTVICVRDLFFNTPARLKFLKSDRSEASACIQAALRCALGRPEVSVRFLRDGKEEFFTAGDGQVNSCVYALLGRELSQTLLPVVSGEDGLSLSGFVSSPAAGRGNRGAQFFFCNGRFIRSALLQSALEQAYKNSLLTGRYPACVIWLEIAPGAVDVNVHPAKTEVKFSEERRVFNLLFQAVQNTLLGEDRIAPEPAAVVPAASPLDSRVESANAARMKPAVSVPAAVGPATEEPAPAEIPAPAVPIKPAAASLPYRENISGSGRKEILAQQQTLFESAAHAYEITGSVPAVSAVQSDPVEKTVQNVDNLPVPDHKILGEALKTYIIVELEDRLLLIDKHASHERMNFDRMRQNAQPVPAQQILAPMTLHLAPEDMDLLEAFGKLFADFGFELEPFGENTVILRAAPSGIFPEDAVPAVEEILEQLRGGGTPDPASARDALLHTVACKAAIKAGWDTSPAELERIAAEVLSGRIKYCPHGRPVSATVTRRELDKLFLRIV